MVAGLISIILGIVFIACFAGFNLGNSCDVNLLFHTFQNVPVFFTILISFAIGMCGALPFALIHRVKKTKQKAEQQAEKQRKLEAKAAKHNKKEETLAPVQPAEEPAPVTNTEAPATSTESETGSPV